MAKIDEGYVIKQYQENSSTYSIAKELGTYPKKIERILKKNGIALRTRSQAQANAIKTGRSKHPTKGEKRSEEEKNKISKGKELSWKNTSDEDREKFSQQAKERWDKIPADKKKEMMEKAGRALRIAAIEGSKAEKFLQRKLNEMGYDVVLHKKDLVEGNFEIDLFLPELNTIIEIDGPQHFLPVFGEKKLQEVIKFDSIKNGLLVSKGFCVVRVRYLCKNMSRAVERKLWDLVSKEVGKIKEKVPAKNKRFIELEIGHE
jgi:very-short-patch-repair endonuclease